MYFNCIFCLGPFLVLISVREGTIQYQKPNKSQKHSSYENCSQFWEFFKTRDLKNVLKPCSHIQAKTQNPNTIFRITIYCTKYTNNTKRLSNCWENVKKSKKENILFCYRYKLHNSYFVVFVILYFCTFCIYSNSSTTFKYVDIIPRGHVVRLRAPGE